MRLISLLSERRVLDRTISESWPEDTMKLGPHAWLPHFRTDAVPALVVALGTADAPIADQGRDGPAPRMILLIVAPPREAAVYLQTVAAFARALSRPDVADGLLAARSAQEVLALAPLREIELEGQLLVRGIMNARVLAMRPDQTLAEAVRILVGHGLDAVPVVGESGAVVGRKINRCPTSPTCWPRRTWSGCPSCATACSAASWPARTSFARSSARRDVPGPLCPVPRSPFLVPRSVEDSWPSR